MSSLTRRIIRATTLSVVVWCILTHLEGLIQFTKEFMAADPHKKSMMTVVISASTFVTYILGAGIVNHLESIIEMIIKMCRAPKNDDYQT